MFGKDQRLPYRLPEGLRELCSDISREVIRSQPNDIYRYVADYAGALLTARENARVAVRTVRKVSLDSEAIVGILRGTGLTLGQIALAAPSPTLQRAFETYTESRVKNPPTPSAGGPNEETSQDFLLRDISESSGACSEKMSCIENYENAQAAFRRHGGGGTKAQFESTTEISRGAEELVIATAAATIIQSAYRGHYTRRRLSKRDE